MPDGNRTRILNSNNPPGRRRTSRRTDLGRGIARKISQLPPKNISDLLSYPEPETELPSCYTSEP